LLKDGSQTYISDATGSKTGLDLTFVDPRSALLYTWTVGTDPWNSDHYPITMKYNGTIEPGKGSKKASRLYNKNPDWAASMEKVKDKVTKVKTHNGWIRERDVEEIYENFSR
jgi:hypothetical protein